MDDITSIFKIGSKESEIIELLKKRDHTISEIKRALDTDYHNAHRYCMKLYSLRLVYLNPPPNPGKSKGGSPVMVSLAINKSGDDWIHSILNRIADKRGRMDLKEFYSTFRNNKSFLQENGVNGKNTNLLHLELFSGYLKKEIVLTKEGKKFLKEYCTKHNRKQPLKNKVSRMLSENSINNDINKI